HRAPSSRAGGDKGNSLRSLPEFRRPMSGPRRCPSNVSSSAAEELKMAAPIVDLSGHHPAKSLSDRTAFGFVKLLRFVADTFFAKRYGHRAVVLETVAAVPGMVGATLNHLKCLRRMRDDRGWIKTLMDEAENERMHLMTFIEVCKPTLFERCVIVGVQRVFYLFF